jgi:superfamily II DNA/RNA helicase
MLGIHIITDALRKYNISFSEISGNLTKDERIHNVKLFNTGVNRVILITSAGSEGIDLKEVRSVVLLEPFWNFARTEQVIGRAVRFRSHSNLPFNKRTVDIYSLILTKPEKRIKNDHVPTADNVLLGLSKLKEIEINKFVDTIKHGSIENDPDCK